MNDGSKSQSNVAKTTDNTNVVVCNPETSMCTDSQTSEEIDSSTVNLWHKRLGHPCLKVLDHVIKQTGIPNCNIKDADFCKAYHIRKSHHLSYQRLNSHAQQALELVRADLWGPAPMLSVEGYKYYMAVVDDCTRYTWIYPLKTKADAKQLFLNFLTLVERQF